MAEDDRQLILRCRNMQQRAYQELMRRYEGYVYGLCYRFLSNREDALDLTQEIFIRVFEGLDSYQVNRPFKPWLRRIAVNTCINFLQRRTPDALFLDQPLADGKLTLSDTVASGEDPVQEMEWQETAHFLNEAVNKLPETYRLLIVLRHQEEMSYNEISAATGIPLGTVKTNLFRARTALRKELATYYAWEV